MKYRVISQSVEINGKVRHPEDVLDESEFRPGDPARHPSVTEDNPEFGEIESLLVSGHIEAVEG